MNYQDAVRAQKAQSKYKNERTVIDGIEFMSKREGKYYAELKLLERAKQIKLLRVQPPYPISLNGQSICTVVADFSFVEIPSLKPVVVDVKGFWTPLSRLKWKLAIASYPEFEWRIVK